MRRSAVPQWLIALVLAVSLTSFVGLIFLSVRQVGLNADFLSAMLADDVPEARRLLERGANPNTLHHINGWFTDVVMGAGTSQHLMLYAVGGGELAKAELLLEYGVDVDSCDGKVPNLSGAAMNGWIHVVELLLENGADPNYTNAAVSSTAIHAAAAKGSAAIVQLLLDAGADPNARDKHGMTPLHRAARGRKPQPPHWAMDNLDNWDPGNQHAEVIKLLLAAGADRTPRNDDGQTAAEIALENNRPDLAELLSATE